MKLNAIMFSDTSQLIDHAIEQSISLNCTVAIIANESRFDGIVESLLSECEGHDDNHSYWGADLDGGEWSVVVEPIA